MAGKRLQSSIGNEMGFSNTVFLYFIHFFSFSTTNAYNLFELICFQSAISTINRTIYFISGNHCALV